MKKPVFPPVGNRMTASSGVRSSIKRMKRENSFQRTSTLLSYACVGLASIRWMTGRFSLENDRIDVPRSTIVKTPARPRRAIRIKFTTAETVESEAGSVRVLGRGSEHASVRLTWLVELRARLGAETRATGRLSRAHNGLLPLTGRRPLPT